MKKAVSILTLVVLLSVEFLTPMTYVFAVDWSDGWSVGSESWGWDSWGGDSSSSSDSSWWSDSASDSSSDSDSSNTSEWSSSEDISDDTGVTWDEWDSGTDEAQENWWDEWEETFSSTSEQSLFKHFITPCICSKNEKQFK